MKISSVEKRHKRSNVRMIYINDEYSFDISDELFMKYNLYEKTEITEAEITEIKNRQMLADAKKEGLRFAASRIRTEKEVFKKLISKGYEEHTAKEAADELRSLGYLDDREYARKYILDKIKLNPKSKELIKKELVSKGISRDTAQNALSECRLDDLSIAETLVAKKFSKFNCSDLNVQKKIYNFLAYRGFRQEVIENIIDKHNRQI